MKVQDAYSQADGRKDEKISNEINRKQEGGA